MAAKSPGTTRPVDRKQIRLDSKEQKKKHKDIEQQILRDKRENAKRFDLLILGSSQAGKSTVIRQMQIIHGTGFSHDELKMYKLTIEANILWSLHELVAGLKMNFSQSKSCDSQLVEDLQPLLSVDYRPLLWPDKNGQTKLPLSSRDVEVIRRFWNDPVVQDLLVHRHQFQLNDSTEYFLDNVQQVLSPDYQPTADDILRVRRPTLAVTEHLFDIDKNTIFRVIDVSGQKTERRKWIQYFENSVAIVFVASVIDYDLTMEEDPSVNRMEDSRLLFKTIMGYPWFSDKAIVLFLNKTDLLETKILHSHLKDFLPSYDGPPHNAMAAAEYIRHVFLTANKSDRPVYSHFTRATDTGCMRFVLEAVRDIILHIMLNRYAML